VFETHHRPANGPTDYESKKESAVTGSKGGEKKKAVCNDHGIWGKIFPHTGKELLEHKAGMPGGKRTGCHRSGEGPEKRKSDGDGSGRKTGELTVHVSRLCFPIPKGHPGGVGSCVKKGTKRGKRCGGGFPGGQGKEGGESTRWCKARASGLKQGHPDQPNKIRKRKRRGGAVKSSGRWARKGQLKHQRPHFVPFGYAQVIEQYKAMRQKGGGKSRKKKKKENNKAQRGKRGEPTLVNDASGGVFPGQ